MKTAKDFVKTQKLQHHTIAEGADKLKIFKDYKRAS